MTFIAKGIGKRITKDEKDIKSLLKCGQKK